MEELDGLAATEDGEDVTPTDQLKAALLLGGDTNAPAILDKQGAIASIAVATKFFATFNKIARVSAGESSGSVVE